MKKILLLLLFINVSVSAQLYKSHDWDETPIFHKLSEEDKKLSSVAIKEKHLIQYHQPLIGPLALYDTHHRIVRVNNDKGIKRHNRVYIPMRSVEKIIDIKARVIFPDGRIINLNKKNIKELKDIKGYGRYKIFAIEGVEKNTQLEIIYTLRKNLSTLGTILVQKDYKINNAEVIIRKPFLFVTNVKSYNGFPSLEKKKVPGKKFAYTAIAKNIPAMVDEKQSASDANRMKVVYLTKPALVGIDDEWSNFTYTISSNLIDVRPKKYKKLISDFEKNSPNIKNKDSLIIAVSDYVNKNYTIERGGSIFENIKTIFKQKKGSQIGIIKIYTSLFNYYKVPYKIVLTSNRFYNKFDKDFFTNTNLEIAMLFFPHNKKFLCPSINNHSLGYPPVRYSNNEGVFISSDNYEFGYIPTGDIKYTLIDREIETNLDFDLLSVKVKGTYTTTGYRANNSRMAYQYFIKNNIEEFRDMEAASGINDAEFTQFSVKNHKPKLNINNTPLIIDYEYSSEEYLEEVNGNYIFNVGKLIGNQSELYQEEKRVNPIELSYPNEYKYIIKVHIPNGYTIKNLEKLKDSSSFKINEKLAAQFISNYKIDKNILYITISEKYPLIKINKEYYDLYKDVVNSAFDFSKKIILFEKIVN